MTQLRTYLHSSCSQESLDGLHSALSIDVVKHGIPCHISSLMVSLNMNKWMNEYTEARCMLGLIMVNNATWYKDDLFFLVDSKEDLNSHPSVAPSWILHQTKFMFAVVLPWRI
jgi:hypothetical protein